MAEVNAACGVGVEWRRCYSGQWDYWTPESYGHPAKMAPGLCHRIFVHLEELGLLQPGMRVLDFMAGTGLTGLVAASRGYGSTLIELEEKFEGMAQANKRRLEKALGHPIDMKVIQGDARQLSSLLGGQGVGVVSPPRNLQSGGKGEASREATPDAGLVDRHGGGIRGGTGTAPGQIGNLPDKDGPIGVVSPPYSDSIKTHDQPGLERLQQHFYGNKRYPSSSLTHSQTGYSTNPNNVGNLPDVGIVSPPYSESRLDPLQPSYSNPETPMYQGFQPSGYGRSEGQIANLPDVGIVSPPYGDTFSPREGGEIKPEWGSHREKRGKDLAYNPNNPANISNLPDVGIVSSPYEDSRIATTEDIGIEESGGRTTKRGYGRADRQIGQEGTGSYLSAMRQVYAEAFKYCPTLVVVVKDPTRNGKIRELGKDTISLLESVGYRIHCVHKAILFEEQAQGHLFESTKKKVRGRLSFFKRLSYRKGSPVSSWEWVIFAKR